jgi:phosphopantothenoylcysteine decarboxylase/phosphopantothenoylcysteine decarboxylase/phosphopantothenate--cysteine ligase
VSEIILGVTGSIAAYRAAELTNLFTKAGHTVHVIMTRAAREFIAPLTFQTLAKTKVYTDMFEDNFTPDVRHISLAQRADVFLIAPASADIIAKTANGIADDMLTTVFLTAWQKKRIVAPAMNTAMYLNPVTQGNIEKLKAQGVSFVEPREARLACGDLGVGALADVSDIADAVYLALGKS